MDNSFILGGAICATIGAITDVRSRRIPNWLTYTGLLLALVARTGLEGWRALGQGLAGVLVGGGIFLLLFLVRGMGAGDVKLMAAVCGWVGLSGTLTVLVGTAFAGGILAIFYMLFQKQVGTTVRNLSKLLRFHLTSGIKAHPELNLQNTKTVKLPYGVAIAIGAIYLLISTTSIAGVIYGH